jgi:hypothetical protein
MHLNREDIKNLLADLKLIQHYPTELEMTRFHWRQEMIESLKGFQKMFGWEKD